MHLTGHMRTMFDLNDVRPAGSAGFKFYSRHAYQWTRTVMKPVGKFMTSVRSRGWRSACSAHVLLKMSTVVAHRESACGS